MQGRGGATAYVSVHRQTNHAGHDILRWTHAQTAAEYGKGLVSKCPHRDLNLGCRGHKATCGPLDDVDLEKNLVFFLNSRRDGRMPGHRCLKNDTVRSSGLPPRTADTGENGRGGAIAYVSVHRQTNHAGRNISGGHTHRQRRCSEKESCPSVRTRI